KIGSQAQLRGCTICGSVNVGIQAQIYEKSVIGDRTMIGEKAIIKPSIKIWPAKTVEGGAIVTANLVWGSRTNRSLFGERGISGEINVDVTPEFASRLGTAFGAMMGANTSISVSADDDMAIQMLKDALVAGLMSAGNTVVDFGQQMLPVTRLGIAFFALDGGVHFALCDDGKLCIDFLGSQGFNIARSMERKLENIFAREDFVRAEAEHIKAMRKIEEFWRYYVQIMSTVLGSYALKSKIALHCKSQVVSKVLGAMAVIFGVHIITVDQADALSAITRQERCDAGILIARNGENFRLFDEQGTEVSAQHTELLLTNVMHKGLINEPLLLTSMSSQGSDQATTSKTIRVKSAATDVMHEILKHTKRPFVFSEQYVLRFDAAGALFKLLESMKTQQTTMSKWVQALGDVFKAHT
ncbi:MAG: hypothetical protein H7Y41_00465, partial [Hyphomonadaceae bacterium]|nr:hypothetical protein [Clostridia bacterium]